MPIPACGVLRQTWAARVRQDQPMDIWVGDDAERFGAEAGAFLAAAPERILLSTVFADVSDGKYPEASFALGSDVDTGEIQAVAIRTPPYNLLVIGFDDHADDLVAMWLGIDPLLPGVTGAPATAQAIAGAWSRQTGGRTTLATAEAMHMLTHVTLPAKPAPGLLRQARIADRAQLVEWLRAFRIETHLGHPELAASGIDAKLEQGYLYVWEHDGQNVAMVGHSHRVSGIDRVGPVYTPAQLRGHGYATMATATLTQLLLDQGAGSCMLFTDLANPISNHIYAQIGYVRFGDWEEHRFSGREPEVNG